MMNCEHFVSPYDISMHLSVDVPLIENATGVAECARESLFAVGGEKGRSSLASFVRNARIPFRNGKISACPRPNDIIPLQFECEFEDASRFVMGCDVIIEYVQVFNRDLD